MACSTPPAPGGQAAPTPFFGWDAHFGPDLPVAADAANPAASDTAGQAGDAAAGDGSPEGEPAQPCLADSDCQEGALPHCNPASGLCQACLAHAHCSPGSLCLVDKCVLPPACAGPDECAALGLVCDPLGGICGLCLDHDGCAGPEHCAPSSPGGPLACLPDLCEPGQGKCVGGALSLCASAGQGFVGPSPCPAATTCVATGAKASCVPWACTPGLACVGTELVSCSPDGLQATLIEDCALSGEICVVDACKPLVCQPGQKYCQGQEVMSCSADGTAAKLVDICPFKTFCQSGACLPQVCDPGSPACVGQVATVCKTDGSGYKIEGLDCDALGGACVAGACKPLLCPKGALYCDGIEAKKCAADGLSAEVVTACTAQQYCKDGVCLPKVCPGGNKPACKGNLATGCNADGSAFVGPEKDCVPEGKVCWEGACVSQTCGNAVAEGPEECDDGNAVETDACLKTCKKAKCGDGIVQAGVEECDDANADEEDGCLSGCIKDCSDRAKKVYVVTEQKVLLRFEVEALKLAVVGTLSCPGSGTPFSMSVDRDATAWVLYNSGTKVFKVSTLDASCQATAFTTIGGFQVFGMGFSSNAPGSKDETLFVAGGTTFGFASSQANLGKIAFPGLGLSQIGTIKLAGGPELTGTGNAELWGFFPYLSKIGLIDKGTGSVSKLLNIPMGMSDVQAWAFAAYGGRFYLFFKSSSDPSSSVFELDPATGGFKKVVPNTGYTITGAGVSSCAPTKL